MTLRFATQLVAAAIVLGAALCAPVSFAQTAKSGFPERTVTLISPFPPGGGNDGVSRAIATRLAISLGQPVIVENKPAANGLVAASFVAKAPADGYTLLMGINGTHGTNPAMYKNLPYDPLGDFIPVSQVGTAPNVLVVRPSLGVKTVQELVDLLKKRPGQLTYGSTGQGSSQHMAGALFAHRFGVDILHVPYRGSAPVITDLLGDQINMSFVNIIAARPHIQSGQLLPLAVTTAERSQLMPDVPTLGETSKGFNVGVWIGVFAPRQTPAAVINTLSTTIRAALMLPEMKAQLAAIGADPKGSSPEEFADFVRSELKRGADLVRITGATAD